jgi:hypothetical protein
MIKVESIRRDGDEYLESIAEELRVKRINMRRERWYRKVHKNVRQEKQLDVVGHGITEENGGQEPEPQ